MSLAHKIRDEDAVQEHQKQRHRHNRHDRADGATDAKPPDHPERGHEEQRSGECGHQDVTVAKQQVLDKTHVPKQRLIVEDVLASITSATPQAAAQNAGVRARRESAASARTNSDNTTVPSAVRTWNVPEWKYTSHAPATETSSSATARRESLHRTTGAGTWRPALGPRPSPTDLSVPHRQTCRRSAAGVGHQGH